jgi:hypothetical protein
VTEHTDVHKLTRCVSSERRCLYTLTPSAVRSDPEFFQLPHLIEHCYYSTRIRNFYPELSFNHGFNETQPGHVNASSGSTVNAQASKIQRDNRTSANRGPAPSGCRFSVRTVISVGFILVLDFVVRNVIAYPISVWCSLVADWWGIQLYETSDTSPPSLLYTPRTSTIASTSLEAIHQNDASQIAQGEVVSCNHRLDPALLIGSAGASSIPVERYVCVRDTVATSRCPDRSVVPGPA